MSKQTGQTKSDPIEVHSTRSDITEKIEEEEQQIPPMAIVIADMEGMKPKEDQLQEGLLKRWEKTYNRIKKGKKEDQDFIYWNSIDEIIDNYEATDEIQAWKEDLNKNK
jgi:TolA-binding protein